MKVFSLIAALLISSTVHADSFYFFDCYDANTGTNGPKYPLVLNQNTATLALSETLGVAAVRGGVESNDRFSYVDTSNANHVFSLRIDAAMVIGIGGRVTLVTKDKNQKVLSVNELACRPEAQE